MTDSPQSELQPNSYILTLDNGDDLVLTLCRASGNGEEILVNVADGDTRKIRLSDAPAGTSHARYACGLISDMLAVVVRDADTANVAAWLRTARRGGAPSIRWPNVRAVSEGAHDFADIARVVLDTIGRESYENAVEHGFWVGEQRDERNDGEAIALMHSELSELLEVMRKGDQPSAKISEFTQAEEEAADLVIRLLDWTQGRGMRLAEAIIAKMEYNRGRPYRHGKKF